MDAGDGAGFETGSLDKEAGVCSSAMMGGTGCAGCAGGDDGAGSRLDAKAEEAMSAGLLSGSDEAAIVVGSSSAVDSVGASLGATCIGEQKISEGVRVGAEPQLGSWHNLSNEACFPGHM